MYQLQLLDPISKPYNYFYICTKKLVHLCDQMTMWPHMLSSWHATWFHEAGMWDHIVIWSHDCSFL